MRRIVLIACCAKKLARPAPAHLLYASPLFRLSVRYAGSLAPDAIFILSAKHGLVAPGDVIAPYDDSLREMSAKQRRAWSMNVIDSLRAVSDLERDSFVFLAGQTYRSTLVGFMTNTSVPMVGLRIGHQMQFLTRAAASPPP